MKEMKKFSYLFILGIIIWSCGGGDSPPSPPKENRAPSVPSLVYPTNNFLCINNTIEFTWNGSVDPDGDNISYEILIAKDNLFTQIVQQKTTSALSSSISLDKGVAHYWKVRAVDSKSKASDYTPFWSFYTEGIGTINYVPFASSIVKPTLNSTVSGTSTILEWTASDVDSGDVLTYDIYFGTSATPPSIVTNHATKTYTVSSLLPNTTYYWKIDVKDNKGGKSIGQVWSFKTS